MRVTGKKISRGCPTGSHLNIAAYWKKSFSDCVQPNYEVEIRGHCAVVIVELLLYMLLLLYQTTGTGSTVYFHFITL